MRFAKAFAYALVTLPAAELAVFIAVALFIGVPGALALLILVSLSGVVVLRRLGWDAFRRRRAATGRGDGVKARLAGGEIGAGIGAILLIIPGFITGLLGAVLVVPASRRKLVALVRRFYLKRRRSEPHVIDLAPHEWQRLPRSKLTNPGRRAPQ
jgi:UPF0716 protein FxsA